MMQYLISAETHDTGVREVVQKNRELQVFAILISSLLKLFHWIVVKNA